MLPGRAMDAQHGPQGLCRLIEGVEAGVAITDVEPRCRQQSTDHAQLIDGPAQLAAAALGAWTGSSATAFRRALRVRK